MNPQLEAVRTHLEDVGYRGDSGIVVPNYEFVDGNGTLVSADYIAFSDPYRQDISSACITVQWQPNGENKRKFLKQVSYIGTPLTLFVTEDTVELWSVRADKVADAPEHVWEINRLDYYFRNLGDDLKPATLQAARRHGRQLSFFHIDPQLEPFARNATKEVLVQRFTEALRIALDSVNQQSTDSLLRVAIWTLAARILQDKLRDDSNLQTRNIIELFDTLKLRFDRYFAGLDEDINKVGLPAVETLYFNLLNEFTFRSLTNDMLAYFYENALVDQAFQKKLGIYYTPRFLGERILQRLPLEDFPPEQRTVFDGTSGSGNLLLAAYDRLSNLLPYHWALTERHQYLLQHIHGTDLDPFACEVARLSLLLYDLPSGDDWNVRKGDIFALPQLDFTPQAIVGNPPFHEPRTTMGKRIQKATEVLKIYLNVLPADGLLAIVMPLTFLVNKSASEARRQLLETCDIYEVWHLNQGVILNWSIATVIIIARKQKHTRQERFPTRVLEVIGTDRMQFKQENKPTISYLASQEEWLATDYHSMASSPLDQIFRSINSCFEAIHPKHCRIHNGVQPGKDARKTHFEQDYCGKEWRKALLNNVRGQILEQYRIHWQSQEKKYIKYPSPQLQWPRTAAHFQVSKKIIINATRNAGGPWRLMAAIDEELLIPTENFHYGLVQNSVTAEEIVAVLNSAFANAWYARNFQGRDINLAILKKLPFPVFSEPQKELIAKLVNQVANEVGDTHNAILQLDEIVFDAYGLSGEDQERVKDWMERSPRPRPGKEWAKKERKSRPQNREVYQGEQWRMAGEVLDVSAESGMVLIEPDYGEAQEIPVPETMPGWAMRPNVAFEALIPIDQAYETDLRRINWLKFEPLDYGYMSEEELLESIRSVR